MEIKPRFSLATIKANLPPGVDPFLPPALAAEIAGVDVKWLANAREGRKAIAGPPHVKLGEGRTAPIRYRLSSLIKWMDAFQEKTTTAKAGIPQRVPTPQDSFSRFMTGASANDKWLFVVSDDSRSATDVFDAIRNGRLNSGIDLQWLTRDDYTNRRYRKATVQLDADTESRLSALGNGNLTVGIEKLLALQG